jgi:hypothetical protein
MKAAIIIALCSVFWLTATQRIRGTHSTLLLLSASLLGAQTTSPQATGITDGPDATIMAPITALASYIAPLCFHVCSAPVCRRTCAEIGGIPCKA